MVHDLGTCLLDVKTHTHTLELLSCRRFALVIQTLPIFVGWDLFLLRFGTKQIIRFGQLRVRPQISEPWD